MPPKQLSTAMPKVSVDLALQAAAELFATKGYEGVGVREIAKRCDVTPATLYYYFGSKERLFQMAIIKKMGDELKGSRATMDGLNNDLDKLTVLLLSHYQNLVIRDDVALLTARTVPIKMLYEGEVLVKNLYFRAMDMLIGLQPLASSPPIDRETAVEISSFILGYCAHCRIERPSGATYPDMQSIAQEAKLLATVIKICRC